MAIFIENFITLCKYLINKIFGFTNVRYIEYEFNSDDEDNDDIVCNCKLCYKTRNILLFPVRRLKYN